MIKGIILIVLSIFTAFVTFYMAITLWAAFSNRPLDLLPGAPVILALSGGVVSLFYLGIKSFRPKA